MLALRRLLLTLLLLRVRLGALLLLGLLGALIGLNTLLLGLLLRTWARLGVPLRPLLMGLVRPCPARIHRAEPGRR